MPEYTASMFMSIFFTIVMVLIPDLSIYGMQNVKANQVTEQLTREIELAGGISNDIQDTYKSIMYAYGLDPDKFTLEISREGNIEYRGKFVVAVKGSYLFKTFNILGSGVGQINLPISGTDSGISEVWIR